MGPLVIPALLAGAQGLMGVGQMAGASNMRKRAERNFDDFHVPQAVNTMLDVAHGMSSQTELPGAGLYRSRAKSGMAQGLETLERTADDPTDVLGGVDKMFADYANFETNMAIKGADERRKAKFKEMDVLKQIGDWQAQEWQFNELYPYMQQMNAAGQLAGAGGANLQSALSTGMNLGMTNWDLNWQDQQWQEYKNMKLNEARKSVGYGGGGIYDFWQGTQPGTPQLDTVPTGWERVFGQQRQVTPSPAPPSPAPQDTGFVSDYYQRERIPGGGLNF